MRTRFLALAFLSALLPSVAAYSQQAKPSGLMTDLVEHTQAVWSGGYATDLVLSDLDKSKGQYQTVEIASSRPSFSWVVPGKYPARQTAWRVIVSGSEDASDSLPGDIWDSGWVEDSRSVAVPYSGKPLEPSKVYYWRVKVRTDKGGESGWSEAKAFRTAPRLEEYSTPAYPLVKEEQVPVSITEAAPGCWLLDFGRDAFGQLRLTLYSGTGEDTVKVHLGERAGEGRVLRNPTTTVRYQLHEIALRKGLHTYSLVIPPDKRNTGPDAVKMPDYIGEVLPFRYVEIEDYDPKPEAGQVVRQIVSYPFDNQAAFFRCDNALLNRIWDLCKYSVRATSFVGFFVDGDRERIPYEADALISQLCHYAADREYTLSRRTTEYLLDRPTWPTEWILQAVLLAWNDYMFTGDSRMLESRYGILRKRCLESLIGPDGLVSTTLRGQDKAFLSSINRGEKIRDIVDWPHSGSLRLAPGYGGEDDGFVYSDHNAVVNAYAFRALTLMGEIAKVLGKDQEAADLQEEASRMKAAFNKTFLDKKNKRYKDGPVDPHASLHSNMFALLFGLVPDKYRKSVTDFIVSRGMACSVYGAQFLLEALYCGDAQDAALKLLTDTSLRSWSNMLEVGSTITLEAWDDSFKPNQDWNHLWGAAPGNIIPFKLMGVEPLEPGFSKVRIRPRPGSLTRAEMVLPTIRGQIFMGIENTESRKVVTVDLPANMDYEADLPEGFSLEVRN
ncbi:MAG: family 78 glycoside hydrolase catalytic domain [Bacteroidales bacterium]|nr:family 78 glycoside hydrolase catalytic domain [Bacteroidales bacterium]